MGFVQMPAEITLSAAFQSIWIFEVRGFHVNGDEIVSGSGAVGQNNYTVAVGGTINGVSNAMGDGDYTDDEPGWAKRQKCRPPYCAVRIGPTAIHTVCDAYWKREEARIITHRAFEKAREELEDSEQIVLPSLETALTCSFFDPRSPVGLRLVERIRRGYTRDGTNVQDVHDSMSGTISTSNRATAAEVEAGLTTAVALAHLIAPRVARFFQLGLRDPDPLKQFLYYFLSIEVGVHQRFSNFTKQQHLASIEAIDARISASIAKLLETREIWTTLGDRFVWCVATCWIELDDSDVQEFKRLKKIRDAIAHGKREAVTAAEVVALQKLAMKVLACQPTDL